MSENLDLVRSIYADWERGDYSRTDWAHPAIEFVSANGPEPGTRTGLAEMIEFWRAFLGAWERHESEAGEYRVVDDERVLVLDRVSTRGKGSGLELRSPVATLFRVRDGKVVKLVIYFGHDRALADLGLAE
jgi:ketosteroid isomerase-like protein